MHMGKHDVMYCGISSHTLFPHANLSSLGRVSTVSQFEEQNTEHEVVTRAYNIRIRRTPSWQPTDKASDVPAGKKKLRGPLQRACFYQAKHLRPDGIYSTHAGRHRHATPPLLPGPQRLLRQSVGDRPSTTPPRARGLGRRASQQHPPKGGGWLPQRPVSQDAKSRESRGTETLRGICPGLVSRGPRLSLS